MNKYQKALNTIADTLTYYTVRKDLALLPSDNEIFDSMATLRELIEKVESFEWIPVSEMLPGEHDSVFADLYGTDKWDSKLWRTVSNRVLVTIKYDDGARIVKESYTCDGKWADEKRSINCKVVAWMPMPNPYKKKLEYENNR